jgi:hypothetical protein
VKFPPRRPYRPWFNSPPYSKQISQLVFHPSPATPTKVATSLENVSLGLAQGFAPGSEQRFGILSGKVARSGSARVFGFRRLNLWTPADCGIDAAARRRSGFSRIPFRLVMPAGRRLSRCLFVIAILITIATVHGRHHYLADAICVDVVDCIVLVLVPAENDKCQSFDTRRHSLCRVANKTCCVSNISTASLSQKKLAHLVLF